MTGQCLLSWDSYKNNICAGFSLLQQREEFVDMTIAADGHMVKVHRNVIALASSYIKEMIQSAPCQHPVIFLHNISQEVLCYILEYIYTGEVKLPCDKMDLFVNAAKALHVTGIENLILPKHMPRVHKRRTTPRPASLLPIATVDNHNNNEQSSANHVMDENITAPNITIDITKNFIQSEPIPLSNLEDIINKTDEVNNSIVEDVDEDDIVDIDEEARGTYNYQDDGGATSGILKEEIKTDFPQLNNTIKLSANQNFSINDGNQNTITESGINTELRSKGQNFINIRKEGDNFVIDTINNSTDYKTETPTTSDNYTNVNYPIVNDTILNPPPHASNSYDWDVEMSTNDDINETVNNLDRGLQSSTATIDSNVLPSFTINLDNQNLDKEENNLITNLPSAPKIVLNVRPRFTINSDNQNLVEEEYNLGIDLNSASKIASNVPPCRNINLDTPNLDEEENNLGTDLQSASKIVSNVLPNFTINLDNQNIDIYKQDNWETGLQSGSKIVSNVLSNSTIKFDSQNLDVNEEENNLGTSKINSNVLLNFTLNVDNDNLDINKTSNSSTSQAIPYYMVTSRGSLTLILNRYLYYMHNSTRGGRKRRWRCIEYRRERCKAFVDTNGEIIMKRKFLHAHSVHDSKIIKKSHDKPMFLTIQEALTHLDQIQNETKTNSRKRQESGA